MARHAPTRLWMIMAARSLWAHKVKNAIVGSILFFGTLLVVVGGSLLTSVQDSMTRSITSSMSGDLQVYAADAPDPLALFGGGGMGQPDNGEIPRFADVEAALSKVDGVAAIVPMGLTQATVFGPSELDRVIDQLSEAVDAGDTPTVEALVPQVRRIAASLSYVLVNQGDAAGLSVCTEKLHLDVPPSRRPAHLQRIFETLRTLEPQGETGIVPALHQIAEKIGQRAFVVILSDLFTEPEGFAEALQHLRYRKHDISVFHLMDPQELSFEFERPHRFVDMEDGTSVVVEPTLVVDEYHQALNEFMSSVRAKCHDANADYQLVPTDTALEPLLREFLTARLPKKGGR